MIQIYKADNTAFDRNGDAVLMPSLCRVKAKLNGAWGAELSHPIDEDGRSDLIREEAIVKLPAWHGDQLFRIKQVRRSLKAVDADLEPIFYDSIGDCFLEDIRPTDKTGAEALAIMCSAGGGKYSSESNIQTKGTAYFEMRNLLDCVNGSEEPTFVSRWGGEIAYDNYKIIINARQGSDHGVLVSYGKNMAADGYTEEVDMTDVVTRIYPQAYNGWTRPGVQKYVDSPLADSYPTIKAKKVKFENIKMEIDASEDDEANGITVCRSEEELDAALLAACSEQWEAGVDKPAVTISVKMEQVSQMAGYEEYAALEEAHLGDDITCRNKHMGIDTTARVIEIAWDAIRHRVESVVLGTPAYSYFDGVTSTADRVAAAIRDDGSVVASQVLGAIDAAKAQLRLQSTVAHKQDVRAILFEDLDRNSPTYGAMALGTQGFQISQQRTADGSDWIWSTFGTAAGFSADQIHAGTLNAVDIFGSTITGSTVQGSTIISEHSDDTLAYPEYESTRLDGAEFSSDFVQKDGTTGEELIHSKTIINGAQVSLSNLDRNGAKIGNVSINSGGVATTFGDLAASVNPHAITIGGVSNPYPRVVIQNGQVLISSSLNTFIELKAAGTARVVRNGTVVWSV